MNNDDLHKPQENSERRVKRGKRSLDSIDSVLSKLVNSLGLDRRLKEHALLSLWPLMIGEVFADKSRPLFLDYEGNLVIAVKDASVAQELSLLKPAILSKMRMAAKSMNLKVNGMRFDLKHYYGGTPPVADGDRFQAHKQPRRSEPTPQELAEITLSESDLQELAELQKDLPPQSSEDLDILKNFNVVPKFGESKCLKPSRPSPGSKNDGDIFTKGRQLDLNQRIVSMFEQELKLRQWRRKQGFPICPKCKQPTQSLHGSESICPDCYFSVLSKARDI
ncbi:MAG: DUF721 domain-containing protein [Candidatus Obscuribacterales bacterium]|nr:DUF721 domain-containing protein [Cyanobacteria bacterium SZAS LIN-5]RTL44735.1 MAG: DUF721 domain-containing protein [Candidatus Melainabacteria bacterium]